MPYEYSVEEQDNLLAHILFSTFYAHGAAAAASQPIPVVDRLAARKKAHRRMARLGFEAVGQSVDHNGDLVYFTRRTRHSSPDNPTDQRLGKKSHMAQVVLSGCHPLPS
eukprot:gene3490-3760_t